MEDNDIDPSEDGPDVMHSKQGDFFEESVSPSSIWGDED